MLNCTLLCVGRLKEDYLRAACLEYGKRLGGFVKLQIVEVEEERLPASPTPAQIRQGLEAEGRRLLAKTPAGAAGIALCIEGMLLSSEKLAETIEKWAVDGTGSVALYIGGSFGLSDEVKQAARLRLSMSPMTFPHQLARVMVLEQLYRAMQIRTGGKYHK